MTDDQLLRRTFLRLLEMHLAQGRLITALIAVLARDDQDLETKIGVEMLKLEPQSEKILALFEEAKTADWIAMLERFDGPAN